MGESSFIFMKRWIAPRKTKNAPQFFRDGSHRGATLFDRNEILSALWLLTQLRDQLFADVLLGGIGFGQHIGFHPTDFLESRPALPIHWPFVKV
jgi:hypothetical protein